MGRRPVHAEELITFESLLEDKVSKKRSNDEPRTLEIQYAVGELNNSRQEVVFEDPEDGEKRPRLLVSLSSVTALKGLCEQEFDRVGALTRMLHKCRCAYFKELLWLREQLLLAARPEQAMVQEAVKAYEVYWYDPPQYVNEEMREFLVECIRHTNRNLIEENYELKMKLGGKTVQYDAEATMKTLLRKLGPQRLLKTLYAFLKSRDNNSKEWTEEFESTVVELAKALAGPQSGGDGGDRLRDLEARLADFEELKGRFDKLQTELEAAKQAAAAAEQAAASERARASAERDRADAERARAEQAEQELVVFRAESAAKGGAVEAEFEHLRKAADRAAERVLTCVQNLGRLQAFAAAAPTPPTSPTSGAAHAGLEQASSALEDLVKIASNARVDTSTASDAEARLQRAADELQRNARMLEKLQEQLRKAQENERQARQEAERLRRASGGDEKKSDDRAERAEAEVQQLKQREKDLMEENQRLLAQLEEAFRRPKEEKIEVVSEDPEKLRKAEETIKELRRKLLEKQEALDEMAAKLSRLQDKIKDLKQELREWKRRCGVEVNSDEDEDSDEEDLPNFLISYAKRNRNNYKPRYEMLAEDATLGRMKREWLFHQRMCLVSQHAGEANEAFQFLNFRPKQRSRSPSTSPTPAMRQHSLSPPRQKNTPPETMKASTGMHASAGRGWPGLPPPTSPAHALQTPAMASAVATAAASSHAITAGAAGGQPQLEARPSSRSTSSNAGARVAQGPSGFVAAYDVVPPRVLASAAAAAASAAAEAAGARGASGRSPLPHGPSQRQQHPPPQPRQQSCGRSCSPAPTQSTATVPVVPESRPTPDLRIIGSFAGPPSVNQTEGATLAMSTHVAALGGWKPTNVSAGGAAGPSAVSKPPRAAAVAPTLPPPLEESLPMARSLGPALEFCPEAFERPASPGLAVGKAPLSPMKPPTEWAVQPPSPPPKDSEARVICVAASSPTASGLRAALRPPISLAASPVEASPSAAPATQRSCPSLAMEPGSAGPGSSPLARHPTVGPFSPTKSMGKLEFPANSPSSLRRTGKSRLVSECSTTGTDDSESPFAATAPSLRATPKAPHALPFRVAAPQPTWRTNVAVNAKAGSSILAARTAGSAARLDAPVDAWDVGMQEPAAISPKRRGPATLAGSPFGQSRSAASLPLTNAPIRTTGPIPARSLSPSKLTHQHHLATPGTAAVAAEEPDGHKPEVLPQLPPGKTRKAPLPPSWLAFVNSGKAA